MWYVGKLKTGGLLVFQLTGQTTDLICQLLKKRFTWVSSGFSNRKLASQFLQQHIKSIRNSPTVMVHKGTITVKHLSDPETFKRRLALTKAVAKKKAAEKKVSTKKKVAAKKKNPIRKGKLKWYIGITKTFAKRTFQSGKKPTKTSHGKYYITALGPYQTYREAIIALRAMGTSEQLKAVYYKYQSIV